MYCFGNNCFAPSPDLRTLSALLDLDIPSPSDLLLAMFKPVVNFLQHSVCAPCLVQSKDGGIDLFCCSCAFYKPSLHLASLF